MHEGTLDVDYDAFEKLTKSVDMNFSDINDKDEIDFIESDDEDVKSSVSEVIDMNRDAAYKVDESKSLKGYIWLDEVEKCLEPRSPNVFHDISLESMESNEFEKTKLLVQDQLMLQT